MDHLWLKTHRTDILQTAALVWHNERQIGTAKTLCISCTLWRKNRVYYDTCTLCDQIAVIHLAGWTSNQRTSKNAFAMRSHQLVPCRTSMPYSRYRPTGDGCIRSPVTEKQHTARPTANGSTAILNAWERGRLGTNEVPFQATRGLKRPRTIIVIPMPLSIHYLIGIGLSAVLFQLLKKSNWPLIEFGRPLDQRRTIW